MECLAAQISSILQEAQQHGLSPVQAAKYNVSLGSIRTFKKNKNMHIDYRGLNSLGNKYGNQREKRKDFRAYSEKSENRQEMDLHN